MIHPSHRWEDTSYHGSPIYECEFCGVGDWKEKASLPCPEAEKCLAEEAAKKEQEDRWEYESMLSRHRRERELYAKYGMPEDLRGTP